MPTVVPRPPRWRYVDSPAGRRIAISARRDCLALPFLTVWVVVCAAAVLLPLRSLAPLLGVGYTPFVLALLPWAPAWAGVGGVSLHAWLWMITGREVVTVSHATLSIQRRILGLGRTRTYALAAVCNVQIVPWTVPPSFWESRRGSVLFDYGSDTVRFGIGLTGLEARQLVRLIRAVAPAAGAPPATSTDAD